MFLLDHPVFTVSLMRSNVALAIVTCKLKEKSKVLFEFDSFFIKIEAKTPCTSISQGVVVTGFADYVCLRRYIASSQYSRQLIKYKCYYIIS